MSVVVVVAAEVAAVVAVVVVVAVAVDQVAEIFDIVKIKICRYLVKSSSFQGFIWC